MPSSSATTGWSASSRTAIEETPGRDDSGSLDIYPHLHVSHDFTIASHIMTPDPHTTTPDTPLKQAVKTLLEEKVGALPSSTRTPQWRACSPRPISCVSCGP